MNPASEPTINANGSMTFPAWFAHRLLSCYYGNGPKADGNHSPSPTQTETASAPTSPTPSSLEGEFAGGVVLDLGAIPRGFKPMGYVASKVRTPPIPDTHPTRGSGTGSEVGGGVSTNGH